MPILDAVTPGSIVPDSLRALVLQPLPGLDAQPRCAATSAMVKRYLESANDEAGLSAACHAGLWLLAGELDRSHELSQALPSPVGSFWHGIMHRREGDYWNAKYWFRKARELPVPSWLADRIRSAENELSVVGLPIGQFLDVAKQADSIVDCCELALEKRTDWITPLQRICWWEWQLLWSFSFKAT